MGLLNDLVAYYKFDETAGAVANDAHTGGYDGDITGATINQVGKIDKAYDFDGVSGNDDVDLTNNAIWNTTFGGADKKFSVSCWIKPDSNNGGMFFSKLADASFGENQRQFYMKVRPATNNKLLMMYYCNLGDTIYRGVQGSTEITADGATWAHIVITYDGSIDTNDGLDRVQMYVDGNTQTETLEFSSGTLGDVQTGTARTCVGALLNSAGDTSITNFDGIIDEVGTWSRVLSSSDVTELYNSGSGLAYSSFTSGWAHKFIGTSSFAKAENVAMANIKKIIGVE